MTMMNLHRGNNDEGRNGEESHSVKQARIKRKTWHGDGEPAITRVKRMRMMDGNEGGPECFFHI